MKRKILLRVLLACLLIISLALGGCMKDSQSFKEYPEQNQGNQQPSEDTKKATGNIFIQGGGYPYIITDYLKNQVELKEKPKRAAVLSGTYLNMWYRLGGESVCRTELKAANIEGDYKEKIKALPSVGEVYNANTEAIIEAQPDFIIAQAGNQSVVSKTLRDMGFPIVTLNMKTYDEVIEHLKVFGKLLENEGQAAELIAGMEAEKEKITNQLPDTETSVVILYVTSSSLSVKLNNSIAGDVAEILRLENIAADLPPDTLGSETTPLDIEYVVEKNPDYVLVTSMISSNEDAKRVMEDEFSNNPAWASVEAVREGKVIYLPQEYFLYNAGHNYVRAIEYMAKGIYPQIYGELNE